MAVELKAGRPFPGPEAWIDVVKGESRELRAALNGKTKFGEPVLPPRAPVTGQVRSAAEILQELRILTSTEAPLVPPGNLRPVSMNEMRYYDTSLRG